MERSDPTPTGGRTSTRRQPVTPPDGAGSAVGQALPSESKATLSAARKAKAKVARKVAGRESVTGVGIGKLGTGYSVRVHVTGEDPDLGVPEWMDDVPVEVITTGPAIAY